MSTKTTLSGYMREKMETERSSILSALHCEVSHRSMLLALLHCNINSEAQMNEEDTLGKGA